MFFDGAPDKVEATRKKFPAALYSTWEALPAVLSQLNRAKDQE